MSLDYLEAASARGESISLTVGDRGSRALGLLKDGAQAREAVVHLPLADDERRQQADHVVVRAVHNQPVAQRRFHVRAAFDGKIQAKDQAFAAHLADEIELRSKARKPGTQLRSSLTHVLEQVLVLEDRQKLQRHRARQRPAAERRSMQARRKRLGEAFLRHDRAERQAAGERLGDDHDVRQARCAADSRNGRPVRPSPHWISSAIKAAP